MERFTRGSRCPVCGGSDDDPRGNGSRCHGYLGAGGKLIFCSREEHAGKAGFNADSQCYRHTARGPCPCGVEHAPGEPKAPKKGGLGEVDHVYRYRDASGRVVFEVVRYKNPKDFRQRRPLGDGKFEWSLKGIRTILYNLPALIAADPSTPVWIVEGEKDADRLGSLGELATCNPMGAGKWRDHYAETLRGRHVVIIPDNDPPEPNFPQGKGQAHAQKVARSLAGVAASVKIVELPGVPEKGDVSDWLDGGHTIEDLRKLVEGVRVSAIEKPPVEKPPVEGLPAPSPYILNRGGDPTSCPTNTRQWIRTMKPEGFVEYDTFRQAILIGDEPLTDRAVVDLAMEIEASMLVPWSHEHVRSALVHLAHQRPFSSLVRWLESLRWDGIPRVDQFFPDHYESQDDEYSRECARVFFLSAVARAYQPGCQADVMPVLMGPQGVGKSTGIAALCPHDDWFADDLGCDLFAGKAAEGLQGKWIFEFGEFARINRSTLDVVKSFITRRVDRYRPPYGRIAQDFPRACVFVGTTNDQQPLKDIENRRFMPIRVLRADIPAIRATREQLWAEAVHRYKGGEAWHVTSSNLLEKISSNLESARSEDAYETILREKLDGRDRTTMIEAAEILGLWDDRANTPVNRLGRPEQTRIGSALMAIGFVSKREPKPPRNRYYEREGRPTSE